MRGIVLVGSQPSAPAAAVTAFAHAHADELTELLLLTTAEMQGAGVSERLQHFLDARLPSLHVVERAIASRVPAPAGPTPPVPADVVRPWLAESADGVVFFADPGLKSLILNTVGALPTDAWFAHGDPLHLYVRCRAGDREEIRRYPMLDIGLEPLLDLFDLSHRSDPGRVPAPLRSLLNARPPGAAIEEGLVLGDEPDAPILHLAYERAGWLYGLVYVGSGADAVRDVQAQRTRLRPLQPQLCILSSDDVARARGVDVQMQAIDGSPLSLALWLAGRATPPGHACQTVAAAVPPEAPRHGRGGANRISLAVWIGLDPSATLNALYTHRPQIAYLLYDQTTPLAALRAELLRALSDELPVDEAHFVASDTLGSSVADRLPPALRADVTPARLSQAIPLAHLAGVELWEQAGDRGTAAPLGSSGGKPLRGAPVVVQAAAVGGPLKHRGTDAAPLPRPFFAALARVLRDAMEKGHIRRFAPLPAVACQAGGVVVARGPDEPRVSVTEAGRTLTFAPWPRCLRGGFWLEDLVAARLLASGVVEEARIGLRWNWPPPIRQMLEQRLARAKPAAAAAPARQPFRDEIDVVARRRHRFCAVSCKTDPTIDVERELGHIAGLAETALGRFCLAVLAVPAPIPAPRLALIERHWRNALILDLATLADDAALRAAIEQGWSRLATRP